MSSEFLHYAKFLYVRLIIVFIQAQDGKTKRERPKKQQKLNSNSKITSNKRRSRAKRSTSDSDDDVHSDDELDEFDSANSESDSAVSSSSCCDESDEDWAAVRKSSSARSNTGVRASSTSIRPIPYQLRNRALTQRSTFAQNQEDQCDSARKIISPSFSEQHIETENTHNTIQMVSPTSSIWNDVCRQIPFINYLSFSDFSLSSSPSLSYFSRARAK